MKNNYTGSTEDYWNKLEYLKWIELAKQRAAEKNIGFWYWCINDKKWKWKND